MKGSKIVNLKEAVSTIQDGDIVLFGGAVDGRRPMAAMYEVIRQKKKNLVVMGLLSMEDILVAAGCVAGYRGCYTHMGVFGRGPGFKRAIESGNLVVDDMGHMDCLLLLNAGAAGASFIGSTYSIGSDILDPALDRTEELKKIARNKHKIPKLRYAFVENPFSDNGEKVVLIPPIKPDVNIIHVAMAGTEGTCRVYGTPGFDNYSAFASDRVIITAEEIVPEEYIRRDPNRNFIPCTQVDMIVHVPWGAHPSTMPGYYDLDMEFVFKYRMAADTEEGFAQWAKEWIFGVQEHTDYLQKLGVKKMQQLTAVKPFDFRPRVDLPRFLEIWGGE